MSYYLSDKGAMALGETVVFLYLEEASLYRPLHTPPKSYPLLFGLRDLASVSRLWLCVHAQFDREVLRQLV